MIRYNISEDNLRDGIEAEKPGWLIRAETRTQKFITAEKYNESSGIWSEIKRVYMKLQHNKCAYCERQLADANDGGTIEHDIEHYRPKNSVPQWPTEQIVEDRDIDFFFETGEKLENGYYWLAYHVLNYCTSCKKCNSPLKKNYFPVAAQRGGVEDTPEELNKIEKPFLIYPIGDLDEDPEELITFIGINPIPKKRNGPRWRRAKLTIKFFRLDTREELLRERAECLVALDNALTIIGSDMADERIETAKGDVKRLMSPDSEHSSCVKAACAEYQKNPSRMEKIFSEARNYLDSQS